jgi:hypothetical protein
MMADHGYHTRDIDRGVFGRFSKIREEFEEAADAWEEQGNLLMTLVELSDLLGAIEGFVNQTGVSFEDLVKMKDATHRAFNSGHRTPRT